LGTRFIEGRRSYSVSFDSMPATRPANGVG
jgi:hypothetical protein